MLELFLKKNPALVFARSHEDGATPWHLAAQVCVWDYVWALVPGERGIFA